MVERRRVGPGVATGGARAMIYAFEAYELDLQCYELRYAGKPIKLEPQVFNVLAYLIQHRNRVVTKEELLEKLWPGRFVSETALTSRLTSARRAIGDRGREQRLIQTLHGRGYRFTAVVEEHVVERFGAASQPPLPITHDMAEQSESRAVPEVSRLVPVEANTQAPDDAADALSNRVVPPSPLRASRPVQVVGREVERARLHRGLQQALDGICQVVFVTGEAGLGKTTLIEMFLQELDGYGVLGIGLGQCIEHYGAGEAYLPVLEALGGLCKESGGQELLALLARQAPTWVVQMPWLVTDAELAALQRRVIGTTQERMLREMAEALTLWTAGQPLILVLEDLHWSDHATLDLITWLARRQEPARLLVLATYRPAEVKLHSHPLQAAVQELKMHRRCEELSLTALTEAAVEDYLRLRFPRTELPGGLAHLVHQRTEGNALFMINVLDAWEGQGWLEEVDGKQRLRVGLEELVQGVPESLRQMLVQQFEELDMEAQHLLEAASVAGVEFSAAAVAAGLGTPVIEAETRCEGLARQHQWLQSIGVDEWPDGTVAGRYGFLHVLYQQVVYQRLGASHRVDLHRRVGDRLEIGYGQRGRELATELAAHFVRGRDAKRAVPYLQYAGENAVRRSAHQEAIRHLSTALELLKTLPSTPERIQQELLLRTTLGSVLIAIKGYAAPEVEQAYARARELCQQVGEASELFRVLVGLHMFYRQKAELQTSYEVGRQLLSLAETTKTADFLLVAHQALGTTLYYLGEVAQARAYLEQGVAHYDPRSHHSHALLYGQDPGVICLATLARALWALGYPDQALERSREAVALAQQLGHPFSLAFALYFSAVVCQYRREWQEAQRFADDLMALSAEQEFAQQLAQGRIMVGWTLVEQGRVAEGIGQIRQSMAAYRATGSDLGRSSYLVLLAGAYGKAGEAEAGLTALAGAMTAIEQHRICFNEAEIYRLKGELLLRQAMGTSDAPTRSWSEAEACLQQALDVARHQGAKSLELRAAMSLSRLWQQQGNRQAARQLLANTYGWFTEGFQTPDLRETQVLLAELA
jgi:predicted ATPase/DNA-binding winged helix-turn-helix (wHTH) protein